MGWAVTGESVSWGVAGKGQLMDEVEIGRVAGREVDWRRGWTAARPKPSPRFLLAVWTEIE